MKLQNLATLVALVSYALGFPQLENFPEYRSLAGLSPREARAVARTFTSTPGAQSLPPAISDTSAKAVYDSEHPYIPDQPGDIRGPCPGLNTLASHGYLPRNGVATPAQIITAVQEGFNMGWNLASFVTYA
ncbi:Chloroperoxidase [Boletus reticuloceps]|uniref:Chloroperoxidase n=1 Tax=Boletus reticuloceps TaxID=495285 RepID=A0A8I3A794_9AGAM|nr:Chloroperoxidase [Boletus reticuloceps]